MCKPGPENAPQNFKISKLRLSTYKSDALLDLVPFIQFKKREKHPRSSVSFSLSLQIYKK